MTIWAAQAGFQEHELGSISVGKYADFVLLDRDIVRIPAEQILATRVIGTYVGGQSVYRAPQRSFKPSRISRLFGRSKNAARAPSSRNDVTRS